MAYYLVGRTSTLKPDLQYSERVVAGSPRAAVRIASRMLAYARKHSIHGTEWDRWYAASSSRVEGPFLIYAQGQVN